MKSRSTIPWVAAPVQGVPRRQADAASRNRANHTDCPVL